MKNDIGKPRNVAPNVAIFKVGAPGGEWLVDPMFPLFRRLKQVDASVYENCEEIIPFIEKIDYYVYLKDAKSAFDEFIFSRERSACFFFSKDDKGNAKVAAMSFAEFLFDDVQRIVYALGDAEATRLVDVYCSNKKRFVDEYVR